MFREPFGAGDLFDAATHRVRHWHHLFGMTEPFAMPFWHVPKFGPATEDDSEEAAALAGLRRDALRDGWPVSLSVPFAFGGCAVCHGSAASRTTIDLLIPDPEVWARADGSRVPARGHSVYRSNPDLDDHITSIVDSLVGP